MKIISIIIAIIAFGFLIVIHEFGHFIAARKFGVKVEEFAIGMGPKLFSKKGKKTTFSLRALPIGGFCAMQGEIESENPGHKTIENNNEYNPEESLFNKKPWQRLCILLAGPVMNLLLGVILVLGVFTFMPADYYVTTNLTNPITVNENITIPENAKILKVNDWHIYTKLDLTSAIQFSSNNTVLLKYKDNEGIHQTTLTLFKDKDNSLRLAPNCNLQTVPKSFTSVIKTASNTYCSLSQSIMISLKYLFNGTLSTKDMSGPVGVTKLVADSAEESIRSFDFSNMALIVALITINLGMFNLLPIPALDGGHIAFIIIEKVIRKPVPAKAKNIITTAFMLLLLGFMAFITCSDIFKLVI